MNVSGENDLLVAARGALLDALTALGPHLDAVILIGAQAIYLHTGDAPVALAEATKDSDLALDTRTLADTPLIEDALHAAGFRRDDRTRQPGAWVNAHGVPVDLMVPESLAGGPGRRGARIPPHARHVARRAAGLEATVVDNVTMPIRALDPDDDRVLVARVAGPAALLIAKLHKLGERQETPTRLVDKDAHDIYRLLVTLPTESLASGVLLARKDGLAAACAEQAIVHLRTLFAAGPDAVGAFMAGRAERGIGDPAVVSASAAVLADRLLVEIGDSGP